MDGETKKTPALEHLRSPPVLPLPTRTDHPFSATLQSSVHRTSPKGKLRHRRCLVTAVVSVEFAISFVSSLAFRTALVLPVALQPPGLSRPDNRRYSSVQLSADPYLCVLEIALDFVQQSKSSSNTSPSSFYLRSEIPFLAFQAFVLSYELPSSSSQPGGPRPRQTHRVCVLVRFSTKRSMAVGVIRSCSRVQHSVVHSDATGLSQWVLIDREMVVLFERDSFSLKRAIVSDPRDL